MSEHHVLFKKLDIPKNPLDKILGLSNNFKNRKFVICHSDIHRKNFILNNDKVFFIDWKLALIADTAYEISVHIHKMNYTNEEFEIFKQTLNRDLPYDRNDVDNYLKQKKVKSTVFDAVRYYKQVHYENTSSELIGDLMGKYSFKLKGVKQFGEMLYYLKVKYWI